MMRRFVAPLSDNVLFWVPCIAVHNLRRRSRCSAVPVIPAPAQKERRGGYTRITRLNQRQGDAGQLAILEWVDMPIVSESAAEADAAESAKLGQEAKA